MGRYPKSVATTWAANFEVVEEESPAAADVLRFSAFLSPDAIPFELLTRGAPELGSPVRDALANADDDPLLVNDLLRPLGRFSLIRIDADDETYSIHRMVQEVLKKVAMDPTAHRLWAERAVRALNLVFPSADYHFMPICGLLLPHAMAARRIEENLIQSKETRSLLRNAGWYLARQAQFAEAETLFRDALKIAENLFILDHVDTATSLNELGAQLQSQHKLLEAEQLSRRALEIREKAGVLDDLDMARSLNNLGYILLLQGAGKWPEAESRFRQALSIVEKSPGLNLDEAARTRNNLAEVLQAEGKLAEAEPLYKQAIEAVDKNPDARNPDHGRFLNNLAGLYRKMGQYPEAERRYKEAIEIRREILGERHPDYASSLHNLAELYQAMDRHADAEPLLKQAEEIRRLSRSGTDQ